MRSERIRAMMRLERSDGRPRGRPGRRFMDAAREDGKLAGGRGEDGEDGVRRRRIHP